MIRLVWLIGLLLLSSMGCTPIVLGGEHDATVTAPPQTLVALPAVPSMLPAQVDMAPDSDGMRVVYVPQAEAVALQPGRPKGVKPAPEPSPAQIILDAQREARVAPSRRGYFGGRGIQRYLWSPGKIWDVYVTPGQATKLELPPGEVLAHHVMLNPKSFDVATTTVGDEVHARSIVLLRPCAHGDGDCVQSKDVDVALTSLSGRSYDLHLIIGPVGMVGVTWEVVPMAFIEPDEPGMLPRRQP